MTNYTLHDKPSCNFGVVYLLLMLITTILVSGCGEREITDLEEYVAKIKAIENPHVDPMPEYINVPPYFYEVQHLRDPFKALIDSKKPNVGEFWDNEQAKEPSCPNHPDSNRVRVGLELIPLDALQMVGILDMEGTMWALVVSKGDGTIYQVKQHDYIGENYGQIINISEDQIDVMELLPDGGGCWTQEVTTISLPSIY